MPQHKKRRKRVSRAIPAKGRLREMADSLWSCAVREDWNHLCAVCGGGTCDAHHLIPRQFYATRYDLRNGIALCRRCHQFDPDISPHQNAAGFMLWLESRHHERYTWLMATLGSEAHKKFPESGKTTSFYCDRIRFLSTFVDDADLVRIVGVRFAAWLDEEDRMKA